MQIERITKPSFTVIGKEGSTLDGPGFIGRLWEDANSHFGEVAHLAKTDADGHLAGVWGAMSDLDRAFRPWTEDFTCGLYLAGVECVDGAEPPAGWTKWVLPGFAYLRAENADFRDLLAVLARQGETLAGAVQEFTDPATGKNYTCVPVRRL